jgi:hypothetical protein
MEVRQSADFLSRTLSNWPTRYILFTLSRSYAHHIPDLILGDYGRFIGCAQPPKALDALLKLAQWETDIAAIHQHVLGGARSLKELVNQQLRGPSQLEAYLAWQCLQGHEEFLIYLGTCEKALAAAPEGCKAAVGTLRRISETYPSALTVVRGFFKMNQMMELPTAPTAYAIHQELVQTLHYIDWVDEASDMSESLRATLNALRVLSQTGMQVRGEQAWYCSAIYLLVWYSRQVRASDFRLDHTRLHDWFLKWRPVAREEPQVAFVPTTQGEVEPFHEWLACDPEFRTRLAQGTTRKVGSRRDNRAHK